MGDTYRNSHEVFSCFIKQNYGTIMLSRSHTYTHNKFESFDLYNDMVSRSFSSTIPMDISFNLARDFSFDSFLFIQVVKAVSVGMIRDSDSYFIFITHSRQLIGDEKEKTFKSYGSFTPFLLLPSI